MWPMHPLFSFRHSNFFHGNFDMNAQGRRDGAPQGVRRGGVRRVGPLRTQTGELCCYGKRCKHAGGAGCWGIHTEEELRHYEEKKALAAAEAADPCAYCRMGCCRFGDTCRRKALADSDYEGAEGEDTTDEKTDDDDEDV